MTKKSKITAINFEIEFSNAFAFRCIEEFRQIINIKNIQDRLFWKIFRNEFKNCADNYFESINKIRLNAFYTWFKKQNVWMQTNDRIFLVEILINVVKKKTQSEWSKKKIEIITKTKNLFLTIYMNLLCESK